MAEKKRRPKQTKPDLREYKRKRDFARTAEPSGGDEARPAGRSFCVQKHDASRLHYDFRLEHDGVLKSWAVPKGPSLDPGQKPLAVQTEDHPIEYGAFEGVIPEGEYGGGTVMLWDAGEWEPLIDPDEGLAKGDLKFRLHGEKLRGDWVLARMSGDKSDGGRNWLLIKKKDDAARPVEVYNVQAELPFSVASGRAMDEIGTARDAVWKDGRAQSAEGAGAVRRRGADVPDPADLAGAAAAEFPARIKPQLCTSSERAPDGDDWLHEVKLDGYRLMCEVRDGTARLLTRNGHDWTDRIATVARAAGRLPVGDVVLDGELVVLDADGQPDFGALQNAFRGGERRAFTYFAFDALYAEGHDLRDVALIDRKTWLEELLAAAPEAAPTIRYCEHVIGHGPFVFEHARAAQLEGIISKKLASKYLSRRVDTWVKVKSRPRQEFVVGGFTTPSGARSGFGALLLGYHDEVDDRLVYCGRVGTGFTERTLETLDAMLREIASDEAPFRNPEADPDLAAVTWVRPVLVVDVEFTAWTNDNLLRHASYQGLRDDIDPQEVVRDATRPAPPAPPAKAAPARGVVAAPGASVDVVVGGVRISHANRAVYPESRVTKGDVAAYYEAVADWMLPHVARRPLSLVRCPLGLAGESFFQRHVGDGFPKSIRGIPQGTEIDGEPFLVIDDLDGLLSLVQMGVLEFHIWGCAEDALEKPDFLVFDLDPGPGILWEHVVAGAEFVRVVLDDLGLESFVKTSGGAGLHVVVPIRRRTGWADAKAFTRAVARKIVTLAPRNFVDTMSKEFRKHRIYVDYLRNTRGATAVAPYSTRARPGACVATPLSWDELSADHPPSAYTVRTVPDRLAGLIGDPWAGYDGTRQSITAAMRKAVGMSS